MNLMHAFSHGRSKIVGDFIQLFCEFDEILSNECCATNSLLEMFLQDGSEYQMNRFRGWPTKVSLSRRLWRNISEHLSTPFAQPLTIFFRLRFPSHSSLVRIVLLQENLYFLSKFIHTRNIWPKMREKFKWKLIF